ncbi:MAG: Mpo1-like protein [Gammaproteobacteria bacterium]|nr:Mpo1-like protein [Gammaproteobacteria bacterium]
MKTADEWFAAYGVSHQDPTNKAIHWVCVPAIVFSLLGLMWAIPLPESISKLSPWLNVATVFIGLALIYYAILSPSLALGMLLYVAACIWGIAALTSLPWPLWQSCLAIFVVAWIGQFIGHKIEGRKPSFFEDIQFLLIGPIWLLGFIYRKLGIPY